MDLGLSGKQVFITGGSVGIGLAVARAFAREGADVAIGARNGERVRAEAAKIGEEFGTRAVAIGMDVTKPEDIMRAAQTIESEFGGIDVVINNAGSGTNETVMGSDDAAWYAIWDLHVMSAVRTTRALVPMMRKRGGGVILNTASICATQPLYYEPIYNTTKAALLMFGKCLANELIPDNIRVLTISPGLILTPDWWKTAEALAAKEGIAAKQYLDRIAEENTPIRRFASPEELAESYLFLCSPKSSYTLGTNVYVDGGWLRTVS